MRTLVVAIVSLAAAMPAERVARIRFTAYAPLSAIEPGRISVSAGNMPVRVVSASPVLSSRPLLLVIDPNSYTGSEIRRRLALFGSLLSRAKAGDWTLRVGIPILDGILSPPLSDPRKISAEIDQILNSYLPQHSAQEPLSAGRTLDLVAGLIERAEKESGGVDCLLLFRDRSFEREGGTYLNAGMERLLSSAALRLGTTLYGWLDQDGVLKAACSRSGGLVWSADTPAEQVLTQIAEARRRAVTLEVEVAYPEGGSRIPLQVSASAESPRLRAPESLWISVDDGPMPDHRRMQEGLGWVRRASEARDDGNFTLARRFSESAVREDGWNPEGHYLAAVSALELGDPGAACAAAGKAVARDTAEERFEILFASACRKAGKAADALRVLRPEDPAPRTPAVRLELARLYAAVGDHTSAKAIFEDLVPALPRDAGVLVDYGEILARLGSPEQSRRQLQAALEIDPANSKAMILLARSCASAGSLEEARRWAAQAVERSPTEPEAHAALSAVEAQGGEWNRAAEALHRAIQLAPDRTDWQATYVDLLCRGGHQRDAVAYLRKSLGTNGADAATYGTLGAILGGMGELDDAARMFEIGATFGGANAHELYRRGAELRERRGDYGQALLDYRAMLRTAPAGKSEELRTQMRVHLSAISLLIEGPRKPGHPAQKDFPLQPALPRAEQKENGGSEVPDDARRLVIPGGLALLTRNIGMVNAKVDDPDVLARIFESVLGSSLQIKPTRENPVLRDALNCVRTNQALFEYLRSERLVPAGFDPKEPTELVFPLSGSDDAVKRTRRLLRFFGVAVRIKRASGGASSVTLVLKEGTTAAARQQVLRNMGVNLTDQRLREVRIRPMDEAVPMILGSPLWETRILGSPGKKSRPLLERFFVNPRAMRLYLALAECSEATRVGLVQSYGPGALLELVEPLSAYGRYLEFKDGNLVFPGLKQSWEALLSGSGQPAATPVSSLLQRDDWRALRTYASLAQAPESVRQYLTATPERLKELHGIFRAGSGKPGDGISVLGQPDLGRTLALMTADQRGLMLPIDARFGRAVLGGAAAAIPPPRGGFEPLRVPEGRLGRFVEWASTLESRISLSPLEGIGLLGWLQERYPEMLDEQTADAIVREPATTASMLDIVIDLGPPAALVHRYFGLAGEIAAQGPKGWNTSRLRTFQSLFHLLALLNRQGALSRSDGLRLFEVCLQRLKAAGEPAFVRAAAEFIAADLLPAIAPSAPAGAEDALLRALAGPEGTHELFYEGKLLRFDAAAFQLKRMRAAIMNQNYTPLDRLLQAFQLLPGGKTPALDALTRAAALIQPVDLSQVPPGKTRAIARADTDRLKGLLTAGRNIEQLADEVAGALHLELGVTLLTYCYAYYGAPEADAMAFDPNFVRMHDFFGTALPGRGPWSAAAISRRDNFMYCSGSLSGLGFELSRLETAQWAQNVEDTEQDHLVPILLTGMRSIPRFRRTDRAQEYVALSVRLARELMATAGYEAGVRSWLESYLEPRVLPRRREQVLEALQSNDPLLAARRLSPSELFMLGREWVRDASEASAPRLGFSSPVLSRMLAVTPPGGTGDAVSFRRELDQYGALLRRKMGIHQVSADMSDSYEQLDVPGREELLYGRMCDLKIKIAELQYALGIPAFVGEAGGELALHEILPGNASPNAGTWKYTLEQIGRLGPEQAQGWMEELLTRGTIAPPAADPAEEGVPSSP